MDAYLDEKYKEDVAAGGKLERFIEVYSGMDCDSRYEVFDDIEPDLVAQAKMLYNYDKDNGSGVVAEVLSNQSA